MREVTYKRDLQENCYRVMAGDTDWEDIDRYFPGKDIKVSPIYFPDGQTIRGDSLKCLSQLADSDIFHDKNLRGGKADQDFCANYTDIIQGNRPDWILNGLEVFVGGIKLTYYNPVARSYDFLWIIGAQDLQLEFRTPRTRLGFDPAYKVYIRHDDKGHLYTTVKEDLGYMRCENRFFLKDPNKKGDNIFHTGNQYLEVTEYAGM